MSFVTDIYNQMYGGGGESEYSGVLKTRKLLILRDAENVANGEIAPNWNVSGTRVFSIAKRNSDYRVTFISELPTMHPEPRLSRPTIPFLDSFRFTDHPEVGWPVNTSAFTGTYL
jgi:hypothetical protein